MITIVFLLSLLGMLDIAVYRLIVNSVVNQNAAFKNIAFD